MLSGRKTNPDYAVQISQEISDRAICILDQVAKTDVFDFIEIFELSDLFDINYYVQTIKELLTLNELQAAAKAILKYKLNDHFDILALVK